MSASRVFGLITPPSRTILSAIITVPCRASFIAHSKYFGLFPLSASNEDQIERPLPLGALTDQQLAQQNQLISQSNRRIRNDEIRGAFVEDMATNRLPHTYERPDKLCEQQGTERTSLLPIRGLDLDTRSDVHRSLAIHSVTTFTNRSGSSRKAWCPLRSKISILAVGSFSSTPSHNVCGTV